MKEFFKCKISIIKILWTRGIHLLKHFHYHFPRIFCSKNWTTNYDI